MGNVIGGATPSFTLQQAGLVGVNPNGIIPVNPTFRSNFGTSGTLLDQCDTIHAHTYTFAASTPQTLDLTSLLDLLGNTVSFARVRLIAFRIQSRTDGFIITVGGAGTNEHNGILTSSSKIIVFPSSPLNDGFTIIQAPNTTGAVVNSGSKLLKLDPGSNAVGAVDVIIAGASV